MGDLGGEAEARGLFARRVEATAGLKIMSRIARSSSRVKNFEAAKALLFHSLTKSFLVSNF
jgi:hypothetical protein